MHRGRGGRARRLGAVALAVLVAGSIGTAAAQPLEPSPEVQPDPATGYLPEALLDDAGDDAPAPTARADSVCTPGALVRQGRAEQPWVSVTYDDGPDANTLAVMDAFRHHGHDGDAEFFMVGVQVQRYPDVAREVAARGFGISNHSVTHSYTPSTIASEIDRNQDLIAGITGVVPSYFRSPGLTQGAVIQNELARQGMCNVFTRFDIRDWVTPRLSASEICAAIRANVRAGDVLLLHDGGTHAQTVLATQTCLFPTLEAAGLDVVPLSQLFTGEPPASAVPRVPAGTAIELTVAAPFETVAGQLTVDQAAAPGYLTAYPCADGRPLASDLNYVRATSVANLVLVRADEAGRVCIYTSADAHIIYDQTAEIDGSAVALGNATRAIDTRDAGGAKVPSDGVLRLALAAPGQVVIGQLTNDQAEAPGYVTAYPCDEGVPATSDLNVVPGTPTSNRFVVRADGAGEVCFFTQATTHLVVDTVAELDSSQLTFGAARLLDTRATGARVPAGGTIAVAIAGPGETFVAQLTVDGARDAGYAAMYPCDEGRPEISHVNFTPARPRSSRLVGKADASGLACVHISAEAHVVIDVVGTAPWPAHNPVRLLDTRAP